MKSAVLYLYEDRKDVTLTTYILQDSPELLAGRKRPAVLICPGGAYLNCSDREAEPVALKFASLGYHAFVLRYSVYNEGGACPVDFSHPMPAKERLIHPAPVREIGMAMMLIRKHAQVWNIDTDRIAVCGFSAGAHNAAMYATQWHTSLMDGLAESPEELRPAAAILGYTVSDYLLMKDLLGTGTSEDAFFSRVSNAAFTGVADPSEELRRELSPARNVTEDTPPTFLWATAADPMVPIQNSIVMAYALAEAGIPFELHIFEEGPHGLSLATQASAQVQTDLNADAAKWSDLAGCWLEKRFALDLPPKRSQSIVTKIREAIEQQSE